MRLGGKSTLTEEYTIQVTIDLNKGNRRSTHQYASGGSVCERSSESEKKTWNRGFYRENVYWKANNRFSRIATHSDADKSIHAMIKAPYISV